MNQVQGPPDVKITWCTSWTDIELLARANNRLVYAMNTCWWKIGDPIYSHPGSGLPCGPRGEVLLETDDPQGFLNAAKNSVAHYGDYGLGVLLIAYHGNIVVPSSGYPTSLENWEQYAAALRELNMFGDVRKDLVKAGLRHSWICN